MHLPPPPLTTIPDRQLAPDAETDGGSALVHVDGAAEIADWTAAKVLVEHLFARGNKQIAGIDYAVGYQLAHGRTGGDIVDIYHFDNGAVSFSIADISGKGTEAAVHAALIKYGLRAYASQGLTPERVMRSLDRLYLENNAFERIESFATVFFGIVDVGRRMLSYASGGHEPVAIRRPGETARLLEPTAPLIGVFDDQHHLFKQDHVDLPSRTLFVATTDGVTEARAHDGSFFGVEGFLAAIDAYADSSPETIVHAVIDAARTFSDDRLHDDIAVLVARFA